MRILIEPLDNGRYYLTLEVDDEQAMLNEDGFQCIITSEELASIKTAAESHLDGRAIRSCFV